MVRIQSGGIIGHMDLELKDKVYLVTGGARGLGRAMVDFLLHHPDLGDVAVWYLGTRDAHGVYAPLGFGPPPDPNRFMMRRRPGMPA